MSKPYITTVAKETHIGWVAAIVRYKSRRYFEYHEGDCAHVMLANCGHKHKQPHSKAMTKCIRKLDEELPKYRGLETGEGRS